jgi:hypothetical protein
VSASEFRDHWADTEAEWSHGGTWLTSFVLPPTAVADAVSAASGQMDLPFLMPVPAAGGTSLCKVDHTRPDPFVEELAQSR